ARRGAVHRGLAELADAVLRDGAARCRPGVPVPRRGAGPHGRGPALAGGQRAAHLQARVPGVAVVAQRGGTRRGWLVGRYPVPVTDALQQRPVLVVDFGAQYAQLIARRVREASVYSEIIPHDLSVEEVLARNPAALILSGGPSSVYAKESPGVDPALLTAGVPVLGICYGFQAMATALGGTVEQTGLREYGETRARITDTASTLFDGQPEEQPVWM